MWFKKSLVTHESKIVSILLDFFANVAKYTLAETEDACINWTYYGT